MEFNEIKKSIWQQMHTVEFENVSQKVQIAFDKQEHNWYK